MFPCFLFLFVKHIIFVEILKQKVMKILTNKKYRELTSYIAILEDKVDLLSEDKADLLSGVLKQNRQLSAKISELEPIVEKFNHKKNLEKARKQKYMAKLKLNKKQTESTDDNTKGISKQEEFVRLMLPKKFYTTLSKKELEVFQDIEKVEDMFQLGLKTPND